MITTETRMLRHQFSPEEHAANCDEMARLLGARDEMELSHKQIKTSLKEDSEALEANLSRFGRFVRDKCDHRKTECRWDMDSPDPGRKSLIRLDTGAVVDTARMEQHELQGELKFNGDGKRVDMSGHANNCKNCDAGIPKQDNDDAEHVNGEPCKLWDKPLNATDPSLTPTAAEKKKARLAEEARKKELKTGAKGEWPEPNEHGVYEPSPELTLEFTGKKCSASIEYLQIGPNEWIAAVTVNYADGGHGSPLTDHVVYPSKEIAIAKEAYDAAESARRAAVATSTPAIVRQHQSLQDWFVEVFVKYSEGLEDGWLECDYSAVDEPETAEAVN